MTSGGSSMVFGFVAGLTPFSTVVKAMVVGSFPRRARNAMIRGEGATSEFDFSVVFLLLFTFRSLYRGVFWFVDLFAASEKITESTPQ
jgi:hypothetical protein